MFSSIKKPFLFTLPFILVTLLTIGPSLALDCPSPDRGLLTRTPSLQDAFNPNPGEGDIELPMPCGGTLVLRPVCVPAGGYFEDFEFSPGCKDCGRPDQGFMEGKRKRPLSGALTLQDLPPSWQSKIMAAAEKVGGPCPGPAGETGMGFYLFIGKYEISNLQWKAVMEGKCPAPDTSLGPDDSRPKTEITWFEAVEFTRRYTEWLLKNAPDVLPRFSRGRLAYLRLPTEDEWEYAARGGHRVSEDVLNNEPFFPLQDHPLSDYAVFTGGEGTVPPEKPAWIGTKCPNPLGLFDTAGNVSEMVLDPFRFTVHDRLQGAVGGFVVKGGSYLKREVEIMPGRREEMPYFLKEGAYKSADVGFRVLLSEILTPDNRQTALLQQWQRVGALDSENPPVTPSPNPVLEIDQSKDPIAEIERLAAATQSEPEKKNLLFLRDTLEKQNLQLKKEVEQTSRADIWGAILTAESISKYVMFRKLVRNEVAEMEKSKMETVPESVLESLENDMAKARGTLIIYDAAVDYFLTSYLKKIRVCRKYPDDFFEKQMSLISRELSQEGDLRYSMKLRLDLFKKHVSLLRDPDHEIDPDTVLNEIISTYAR